MNYLDKNKKVTEHLIKLSEANIARDTKALGIKEWKAVLDFERIDFSIKSFREAAYKVVAMKAQEANAELSFGSLLRAGVQNSFNDVYQAIEVTYEQAVRKVSSNKRQEFYSPLERIGMPKLVETGAAFPETTMKGLDIEIINRKWGMMFNVERELVDDDQTGQIVQRAAQMGENARIFEEYYVWNRIINSTNSLDGQALPVSATYATVYSPGVPGVSGGIHGSGRGVNATSAARVSQSQIQAGYILQQRMLDQSGRPMVVIPKFLAVSPQDIFYVEILLGSNPNPSKASSAGADDGKVGGIMSKNPLLRLGLQPIVSRAIVDYGAVMIDPKGFAMQVRDPAEVIQENPQSGPAFSQEVFRYKLRERWEADFIDPKFCVNLNTSFSST